MNDTPIFPGGIMLIGPDGSFGAYRKSIVEIKGAFSSIVIPLEPNTGHFVKGEWKPLLKYDHITIHPDLNTHLQGVGNISPLVLSSAQRELTKPICLASISAAPSLMPAYKAPRYQKKYQGGSAIVSLPADEHYNPSSTHTFVDIWALPLTNSHWTCPPKWMGARPILGHNNIFGPIPAPWAFRRGLVPKCQFILTYWLAEVSEAKGPIVITTQ